MVKSIAIALAIIGLLHQRVLFNDVHHDLVSMRSYGSTCMMDSNGFIRATCSANEVATVPGAVWAAIGRRLALQWLAETWSPYFVTTCIKSPKKDTYMVALVFLAGYNKFPLCQPPSGPQEIAGMAMVETTVRDEYPNGAYMLTVFADRTMNESVVYENSGNAIDLVIASFNQSLISTDGIVTTDTIGITSQRSESPLGPHYVFCSWNVGRQSKKAVTITWQVGHVVANRHELLSLQLTCIVIGFGLVSSDLYLTITGLRGFLHHKPVMTYDLAVGIERRRLPLFLWVVAKLPSLLYADVARLYEGTTPVMWFFVCVHPSSSSRVIQPRDYIFSPPPTTMAYGVFVGIAVAWTCQYENLMKKFNDAPFLLGFNISGVLHPSGAYAPDGVETVISAMASTSLLVVAASVVLAILLSICLRKRNQGTLFMNLDWTRTNGFLNQCGMPNWITSLPLDEQKMIKIGNKLFCKPSTQVTLGYASIVQPETGKDTTKSSATMPPENETTTIISVYCLLPILLSMQN
ncbi:hypothetical protein AeMF1_005897 [Aphanomyces euteiches]|nr:hypothetical protein AeMF1_005897 [Aphanomyces euteiches]